MDLSLHSNLQNLNEKYVNTIMTWAEPLSTLYDLIDDLELMG